MERRGSPPKHRHDGTSPLPLGMDWSPPPKKWNGRDTIWPHDPRTGWSYCITIPTWVVLPKSRDSDPVVFYRVQVGLQSPEGVTTTRTVSRRFNDFLRLLAALRKAFPKKNLPPAPPKGLLRLKSRTLLEERRCSLEEWMTKLLSDIDISRSIVVASFLELESAARSSFQDENPQIGESSATVSSSPHIHPNESESTPDYNSDTAYDETSEIGTSRDNISEDLSLDEDLVGPLEKLVKHGVSNIDEGLLMGNAILDQVEGYSRNSNHSREINMKGSSSNSSEKNGQQQKMNRVVVSMKRRLGTAKTDMEDLISRLNQEIAVKDYLTTKVKDLEEELETTKVRSKENLHQAILMERERVTQMQWDMEELRRKSLEMEFKLKSQSQQYEKVEETKSVIEEKDELLQELEDTKSKLEQVSKKHQELEIKSKADVKILVKEVKSLRTSQAELKQQLNQSLIGKSEAEKLVQQEKERMEEEKAGRMKLLHECDVLQKRLKECSMNLVINGSSEDKLVICSPSVEDALQLVKISDDRMEALLAQAQMLAEDDSFDDGDNPTNNNNKKLRKILSEILVDNITLRRQVSLLFDGALKTGVITTTKDMEVSLDKS
ncbi:unnamed protein product [Lactuca saligna]|uniref:PX domain-containing protein n=1 Tax=Lactuca saligna TaxID=75948 RepID=A0AA35Z1V7_LACSI|nr:unnamed protein product [Lactuca saligna]